MSDHDVHEIVKTFHVYSQEMKQFKDWATNHRLTCRKHTDSSNFATFEDTITWCFTQTGIGVATYAKCACGEEVNVTNYSCW